MDTARNLVEELRNSEEYLEYKRLKAIVDESPGHQALLKEYQKLNVSMQVAFLAGKEVDEESEKRFSQLSAVLFASEDASNFLLAQMRLRMIVNEVLELITDAADMPIDIPEN